MLNEYKMKTESVQLIDNGIIIHHSSGDFNLSLEQINASKNARLLTGYAQKFAGKYFDGVGPVTQITRNYDVKSVGDTIVTASFEVNPNFFVPEKNSPRFSDEAKKELDSLVDLVLKEITS